MLLMRQSPKNSGRLYVCVLLTKKRFVDYTSWQLNWLLINKTGTELVISIWFEYFHTPSYDDLFSIKTIESMSHCCQLKLLFGVVQKCQVYFVVIKKSSKWFCVWQKLWIFSLTEGKFFLHYLRSVDFAYLEKRSCQWRMVFLRDQTILPKTFEWKNHSQLERLNLSRVSLSHTTCEIYIIHIPILSSAEFL